MLFLKAVSAAVLLTWMAHVDTEGHVSQWCAHAGLGLVSSLYQHQMACADSLQSADYGCSQWAVTLLP